MRKLLLKSVILFVSLIEIILSKLMSAFHKIEHFPGKNQAKRLEKLVSTKNKKRKVIITFDTIFAVFHRTVKVDKQEMVSAGVQMGTDNQQSKNSSKMSTEDVADAAHLIFLCKWR